MMKKITFVASLCLLLVMAVMLLSCSSSTPASTVTATITAPGQTVTAQPSTVTATASTVTKTVQPSTTQTTAPTKDKIVIGMSSSITGPLASTRGSAFDPVYKEWVKEVNAAGGINVGGKKLPVEMLVYDDKSDLGTMTQLVEKLIVQDKVDFLFSPCSTAFIFAAAPIANKYGYILSTMEGGATQMKDILPALPYVFVNLSFSDWYQIPVLADILSKAGAKTAYMVYLADLHGIEYSGVTGIEFPKKGIQIIGSKSLPPEMTDFSLVVKEAKAANPDVFLTLSYPNQNLPITAEMMTQGFNPKAFMCDVGGNFGFYHTGFKSAVNGVLCFASWSPKLSPQMKALYDKLYTGQPEDLQDAWGHSFYWAGLQVFQQAIEKAGTLDQKVIRDIMATQHFQTILGDTYYENGLMAKESHPAEIGQWQNEVIELVGGNQTTSKLVYPKPAWPK